MASRHRRLLLVPVLLGALLGLAAPPVAFARSPGETGTGAEVARLYAQAATATRQYEDGQRAAREQREEARRLDGLLAGKRQEIDALHQDLGRIVRAQYRSGGGLPQVAEFLLAENPGDLLRDRRIVRQANRAVSDAVTRSRRAERDLAAQEEKATKAWAALDDRNGQLARLKQDVEQKLEAAQQRLQNEAEQSVAAGKCSGAVRLEQDEAPSERAWVAPVDRFELSAGFDSAGSHWSSRHTGQDFAVPIGTPVRVAGAGRVVSVSCGGAFGIEIVVRHSDGYFTQYAHLSAPAVDEGERVRTGQWIGQSGSTGNSTGPHLHFEVRLTPRWGSAVDPVPWLAERDVPL